MSDLPPESATISWLAATAVGTQIHTLDIPIELGPVRLIKPLGAGGMGVVWRARHTLLNRDVAVKFVLSRGGPPSQEHIDIFLDGARAAAQVRHLGLTAVLNADVIHGIPYLVMEFIDGETLHAILRQGPLTPAAALAVIRRVADALDALHTAGALHRDIKPANIIVATDGQPYLTDFGLACLINSRPPIGGTPGYTAPECWTGECSVKAEVFALAVVAAEAMGIPRPACVREIGPRRSSTPSVLIQLTAETLAAAEVTDQAAHADLLQRTGTPRKFIDALTLAIAGSTSREVCYELVARVNAARVAGGGAEAPPPATGAPRVVVARGDGVWAVGRD